MLSALSSSANSLRSVDLPLKNIFKVELSTFLPAFKYPFEAS
jgi:hypothetical protein